MTNINNNPKSLRSFNPQQIKRILMENFTRDEMRNIARELGVPQGRLRTDLAKNLAYSPEIKNMKMSTTLMSV